MEASCANPRTDEADVTLPFAVNCKWWYHFTRSCADCQHLDELALLERVRPSFRRVTNTPARRTSKERQPVHQSICPASIFTEPSFCSKFVLTLALHVDPTLESMLQGYTLNAVRGTSDVIRPGFTVIPHYFQHLSQQNSLCASELVLHVCRDSPCATGI